MQGSRDMIRKWHLAGAFAVAFAFVQTPGTSNAFECPRHFAAAQAAIDKVVADMGGGMVMTPEMMAQVNFFLDNARRLLAEAMAHHEGAQGGMGHGKSIADADAALGYAQAGDIFHFKMMAPPA